LLREGDSEFEVFMVKRPPEAGFAANALVFPGGRLDNADSALDELGSRVTRPPGISDHDLALRICAIRETFEEAGVLLARPRRRKKLIDPKRAAQIARKYRKKVHNAEITLAEMVVKEDLELACDELVPFAHWITPQGRPRRFDTWFYLARAPEGQLAAHDTVELVDSMWGAPATTLADADSGKWVLVFATRMNLMRLAESRSLEQVFERAESSDIVAVEPTVERVEGGNIFRIPATAGYPLTERFEKALIPATVRVPR
jgi:8-oxo-dGTP pyrophosphatase MutT (NUDIX family)